MCASRRVIETRGLNESKCGLGRRDEKQADSFPSRYIIDRPVLHLERFELERTCWDPKDGELCLNRVKPAETLVEARSVSDVQIDRRIWV